MGTFTREKSGLMETVALLVLCALFFVLAVGAIATGVSAYGRTNSTVEENNALRTAMAYISNQARQGDISGGVEKGLIFGRDALILNEHVLDDEGTVYTYCTFIYCYDGYLRELYTEKGLEGDMGPEAGTDLIPLDSLDLTVNGGMITATVGWNGVKGSVSFWPRSAGAEVTP